MVREFVMMMGASEDRRSRHRKESYSGWDCIECDDKSLSESLHDVSSKMKSGSNLVFDGVNFSRDYRMRVLRRVRNVNPNAYTTLILCMVPLEVPGIITEFECPNYYECWDKIQILYEPEEVESTRTFYEAADMEHFDQKTHHHLYPLMKHMSMTSSYLMNKDITDFGLITAGLFHDIGKIRTQTFVDKAGDESADAHYYNHQNVSSYDAIQLMLANSNYRSNTRDILDVCDLICMHMAPIIDWPANNSNMENYIKIAGKAQTARVLLLSEADRAAHGTITNDRKFILDIAQEGY